MMMDGVRFPCRLNPLVPLYGGRHNWKPSSISHNWKPSSISHNWKPSSISTKFLLLLSRSVLRKGASYQPEMAR